MAADLKTIYTAATVEDAQSALLEFNDIWGEKYPHITQSWTNHWNELATFFKYPQSIPVLKDALNPKAHFLQSMQPLNCFIYQLKRFRKNEIVMVYVIGVKSTLNFVYFSAKLWKNIQGRFTGLEVIYTVYFTGSLFITVVFATLQKRFYTISSFFLPFGVK